MPTNYQLTGGSFDGYLNGAAEAYQSNDFNGNGTISKGNFVRTVLDDATGIYITYTDNSFVYSRGHMVMGAFSGTITELSYTETTDDPDVANFVGRGNGNGSAYNVIHVKNAARGNTLAGLKKLKVYNDGVEEMTISTVNINLKLTIGQKVFRGRRIFNSFVVSEIV